MTITAAALRLDKKCGKSGIPAHKKCSKKTTALASAKPQASTKSNLAKWAAVGISAAAVAGIATVLYNNHSAKAKILKDLKLKQTEARARRAEEHAAIYEYVSASYHLNRSLRAGGRLHDSSQTVKEGLDSWLKDAPTKQGVYFRGIDWNTKSEWHTVKAGGVIKDPAFGSFTSSRKKGFQYGAGANDMAGVVIVAQGNLTQLPYHVKGRYGQQFGDSLRAEQEYLAKRETQFKVLRTKEITTRYSRKRGLDELVVDPEGDIVKKRRLVFVEITDPGRTDAIPTRLDKKCGKSGIAASKKCSKKTTPTSPRIPPSLIGKVALGAGAITGVALLARQWGRRDPNWKGFTSPGEDWDQIEAEARKGGKKWDVFEKNKKAALAACAATKVDAWIREDVFVPNPRCFNGEAVGAFGNYVVHPSGKYGIKYLHNQGDAPDEKFRSMGLSLMDEGFNQQLANGVGVPSPKVYKVSDKALVMEHLPEFRQLAKEPWAQTYSLTEAAPFQVKMKLAHIYQTLHTNGIAHNDAHTNNILYNPRTKELRLIDFGLATLATDEFGADDMFKELRDVPSRLGLPSKPRIYLENKWAPRISEADMWLSVGDEKRAKARIRSYYSAVKQALSAADRQAGGLGFIPYKSQTAP